MITSSAVTGKHSFICTVIASVLSVCLFCCAPLPERSEQALQLAPNEGRVILYLNGPEKASLDVSFNLTKIEMVSEDGTPRQLLDAPQNIGSHSMAGRQIHLSEKGLPEGKYKMLRLFAEKAAIRKAGRTSDLSLPEAGIECPVEVTVARSRITSLFLHWNADASVTDGYRFTPVFEVRGVTPQLSSVLAFVTNEESDSVTVINRQMGQVVANALVGKRPKGIAAGTVKERFMVYVANAGSDSVSVIDPTTNNVDKEISVRFGRSAEGIAVAAATVANEFVFVANYGSNTVSIISAQSSREFEKVDVMNGPIAVAADPPADEFLNSRLIDARDSSLLRDFREQFFFVYVANRNSNTVSVLKIRAATGRCEEVINLKVEWSPLALSVDAQRARVYVANYGSDRLSVIDILKLIKGQKEAAVRTLWNLGTTITAVLPDPALDRVYLLRESAGEIVIIRPPTESDFARTGVTPIIGTIRVGRAPRAMTFDPEAGKIYVLNRGDGTVSVIDRTTRREEKVIPTGKKPYGITLFPF